MVAKVLVAGRKKDGHSRKVQARVAKSDGSADVPQPVNAWAEFPPQTCTSCNQSTHDIDKDSPPEFPAFVWWLRTQAAG